MDDLVEALIDVLDESQRLPWARRKFFETWIQNHFPSSEKTTVDVFSELELFEAKRELEVILDEFEWCKGKSFDVYHSFL